MCVSDIKRIYLASEINRDFALVLEAIFSNKIVLALVVIIKGQQIMY